jgi:hypothetical protein
MFSKEAKKEPISVSSFATLETTSRFKTIIVSRAFSSKCTLYWGFKSFLLQVLCFMIIGKTFNTESLCSEFTSDLDLNLNFVPHQKLSFDCGKDKRPKQKKRKKTKKKRLN